MKTYTAPPPIADVRLEVVLFFFELLNIGNDYGRFKNCSNGLRLPFSSSGCSIKKSGDPHEGGKPEEDGETYQLSVVSHNTIKRMLGREFSIGLINFPLGI